jgi:hypothetical protein
MKATKLQRLISFINPEKNTNFCVSIGGYWTIEINGSIVRCTLDWNKNSCLNEKCKLENESQFKQSDLKYLYSVLNGYLKGKYQTITN